MKLKTIVASLVTLGLSGPILAMQPYYMDTSYQMDVMQDQMNKTDLTLNQNQPGGFDQPCGWTCRINVSGWINTDAYIASHPPVFFPNSETQSGRASDLILNNANLFVNARANNWVTAMLSLVYSSLTGIPGSTGPYALSNSLLTYHPVSETNLDTAYATIGNFQVSPVYLRVGKAYVPFGQYDPYAFVQSENPTQLFTEISETVAQLGFIMPNGLYGSAYTFAGNPKTSDEGTTRRIQNGGVDLGYNGQLWNGNTKINLDAGYIANITDANYLSAYYLNQIIGFTAEPGLPNQKVPAWNVNADLTFGPFDVSGHYIGTTRSLVNPWGLGLTGGVGTPLGKPNVWGVEAGLTVPVMAHQSRVALGWQQTTHLPTILPQKRIYIDYLVNFAKWFDMGIAVVHDRDYNAGEGAVSPSNIGLLSAGATGNKSTFGQLRASVKFA